MEVAPPNPFFEPRLLGLADRRLDLALTLALLALVVASRIAAFPASIWEQDEAYFATAVVDFDPVANHPHPPWFPLWIAAGRLAHAAGAEPATGLQLVSVLFGVWILFPLTAMWSPLLGRRSAVAAAVLFLAAPGPWLLAGRAFTGTAATALLVCALACWLREPQSRRWAIAGSLAAGLCIAIRPHFVIAVAGIILLLWRRRTGSERKWMVIPLAAVLAATTVGLLIAAGGVTPLADALDAHVSYHFDALDEASLTFSSTGFARSLGHPVAAGAWIALAVVGLFHLARRRELRPALPILLGALLPIVVLVHALSNPAHARYAVPLLALSSGLVVAGLEFALHRFALPAVAVAVAASAFVVLPQLDDYRSTASPPLRAVQRATREAGRSGGVIIADRTLISFFDYAEHVLGSRIPVVFDHYVEIGATVPPPPAITVAVFDRGHDHLVLRAPESRTFTCDIPLLRRLAQNRFLDVTVAPGATLSNPSGRKGPFVLID